jgi:hypothetical protein
VKESRRATLSSVADPERADGASAPATVLDRGRIAPPGQDSGGHDSALGYPVWPGAGSYDGSVRGSISIGREPVSKTGGSRFESWLPRSEGDYARSCTATLNPSSRAASTIVAAVVASVDLEDELDRRLAHV